MEVPLDGAHRPAQCLGQGLHLGPAQATLVVGVVRESAVGRDRLGGDSGEDEGLDLGDTGKFGLLWHRRLLRGYAAGCASAVLSVKIGQSGGPRSKGNPTAFLCTFYWCVLYILGHPRASPRTIYITTVRTARSLATQDFRHRGAGVALSGRSRRPGFRHSKFSEIRRHERARFYRYGVRC